MPKLYLQGHPLKIETKTKYLGLTIDQHLTWDDHVTELCKKLRPKVGLLSRVRHLLPYPQVMMVYMTTIQSVIDYGLSIWGSCSLTNRLMVQRLQNRCARLISNNFDRESDGLSILGQLGLINVTKPKIPMFHWNPYVQVRAR